MATWYKDDQYVYRAKRSYEGNTGVSKCAASDLQIFSTDTWRFKTNETIVERIITSGVCLGTADFNVPALSDSELKISLEDDV